MSDRDALKNVAEDTRKGPEEKKPAKKQSTPRLFKILRRLGIKPPAFLNHKTPHCRHGCGCIENIISGTARSFALGYVIKACLNMLGVLFAFKKLKKKYKKSFFT